MSKHYNEWAGQARPFILITNSVSVYGVRPPTGKEVCFGALSRLRSRATELETVPIDPYSKHVSEIIADQPTKYILAGGLNTAICFAVYLGLVKLGMDYVFANFIAWVVGVGVSFSLNLKFVFRSAYHHKKLFGFISSSVFCLIFSTAALSILVATIGMSAASAAFVATPCVIGANFLLVKYLVFS